MPKVSKDPEKLRPYLFHGVELEWAEGDLDAIGTCPFCSREQKFSVQIKTGLFRCFVCTDNEDRHGGNIYVFLQRLLDVAKEETTLDDYHNLSASRGIKATTLKSWGVAKSTLIDGEWLIPGYNTEKKLTQVYRYTYKKALATPTLGHKLHLHKTTNYKKENLLICEGPWDAMRLWEVMRSIKAGDKSYKTTTKNINLSLLKDTNVIGVPGCNVFFEEWSKLTEGKNVSLLFDNDHPREHNGKLTPPAAFSGIKRVAKILCLSQFQQQSINYLQWGPEGFDLNLESGTDLRDVLMPNDKGSGSVRKALKSLLGKITPIPEEWLENANTDASGESQGIELLECETYEKLQNAWEDALSWGDGLDVALTVMLASVASTMCSGDQLWLKIISPPSGGKSTLAEAISSNKQYTIAKSTIRGLHSGFDAGDGEDNSLLSKVCGKTLLIKDGDTLLQSPNKDQVFSEFRDSYDRVSRSSYRNKMSRDYEGLSFTVILCGTSTLRSVDKSELGARFLDCVIMDEIDPDQEARIAYAAAKAASSEMMLEVTDDPEKQESPEKTKAKQLTGGYVAYLRQNVFDLMSQLKIYDKHHKQCANLGIFVAFLRARPSEIQDENAEREIGIRLTKQLMRLAVCLTIVLNKKTIDAEVMRRVTKVALNTARGQTLNIVKAIYATKQIGMEQNAVCLKCSASKERTTQLLRFLKSIGVVEIFKYKKINGAFGKNRYRLTPRINSLYKQVITEESINEA